MLLDFFQLIKATQIHATIILIWNNIITYNKTFRNLT